MKIYLIRHGETYWNEKRLLQGSTDIELNDYGRELARITSEAMKDVPFEIIYSSPLVRARDTAEIMRRDRQIPIVVDERLREMNFGVLEGEYLPDMEKDHTSQLYYLNREPDKYIPENGESFQQVTERAREFIEQVLVPAKEKYDTVLIAAHGALIRCFLRCIEQREIKDFWKCAPHRNCAVTLVEMDAQGGLRIVEEGKLYYEP